VRLLVDSHVALWWLDGTTRGAGVRRSWRPDEVFFRGHPWELGIKRSLGKLSFDGGRRPVGSGFVTVDHQRPRRASGRPAAAPSDPFDRMLVAQAQAEAHLVTADRPRSRRAAGRQGLTPHGATLTAVPHLPGSPAWQRDSSHSTVLDYHLSMLHDTARMDAFRRAIDASVQPGDIVVDLGCGSGVLSFMACEAGAGKVYAIEGGPVIDVARELAVDNGFDDRIEFLAGWSIEIGLLEPADVLISETIGNAGLDEGIVAWTFDARNVSASRAVLCPSACAPGSARPSRSRPALVGTGSHRAALRLHRRAPPASRRSGTPT
jgi:PIN domain nuclease of toxin-antitoxin system